MLITNHRHHHRHHYRRLPHHHYRRLPHHHYHPLPHHHRRLPQAGSGSVATIPVAESGPLF